MGAKGEALAKKFEAKVQEATAVFEKIGDADWKKVTSAEKWPVCVVAHHIAQAHLGLGGIVKRLADGTAGPPTISMDDIHAMNAQHAKEFAQCTKAETLALHRQNAATVAAILRGIEDAHFERKGPLLKGVPEMSAEQTAGGRVTAFRGGLFSFRGRSFGISGMSTDEAAKLTK